MNKMPSQARSQRRSYELWLKKNNPQEYKKWKSNFVTRGRLLHEEHVRATQDFEEQTLEKRQADIIVKLKEAGKSDSEVDRHIGIWIKTIKQWASDEPRMNLRKATRSYDLENSKIEDDNDSIK